MFTPFRMLGSLAGNLAWVPVSTYRHSSHSARDWTGSALCTNQLSGSRRTEQHDASVDDLEMDEVESKLEAFVKTERKKEKSAKFHRTRQRLSSSGAPERRLSWDAIQQIRYLKQESPQEWTLQKLAEGFSVSPDIIYRVLRSKFTPPPDRRLRQDAKALSRAGPLSLEESKTIQTRKSQSQLPSPTSIVPALISSGNTERGTALISSGLTPAEYVTGLISTPANALSALNRTAQITTVAQETFQESPAVRTESITVKEMEKEEWDGVVFTDKELEKFIYTLREKPSPVEQKGREFYDSDGNFLYRI